MSVWKGTKEGRKTGRQEKRKKGRKGGRKERELNTVFHILVEIFKHILV